MDILPMYQFTTKCLFITLLLGCFHLKAQKVESYYESFKGYRTTNFDSAMFYAQKTIDLAANEGDSVMLMKANNAIGWLYKETGKIDEGISYFVTALTIADKIGNIDFQIYVTNNLGNAFSDKDDYDKALEFYYKSHELRKEYSDEESLGISLNNIGSIYHRLEQFDKALEYFSQSLEIDKKYNKDNDLILTSILNIAKCYLGKDDYESAIKKFDEVINSCLNCSEGVLASTYNGLGIVYYDLGANSIALENFQKSENYTSELLDKSINIINNYYLSLLYFNKGEIATASEYNIKSMLMSHQNESKLWQKENYLIASMIEEAKGNKEQALDNYKNFVALNDSILNEQVVKNIQEIQQDYNDKQYKQHLASMDLRLAKQNKMNTLLIVMVGMVSVVGLVLYNANKNRKRATSLISKAYIEVERQKDKLEEAVKERTKELDKSNQDLTNFIYRTSHDIRGPLATLKGICNIALLDVNDPVAVKYFNKLELTSDRLIDILSRIQHINLIKNYKMESKTINVSRLLNEVVDSIDDNIKSNADYVIDIPETELVNSDENLLKIALKNILHNAFKFSRQREMEESMVIVEAHLSGDQYFITVTDNGYGIEQGEMNKIFDLFYKNDLKINGQNSAGIGLHLAEMAIKKLNGSIYVESIPMVRTSFSISVPVEKFVSIRQ